MYQDLAGGHAASQHQMAEIAHMLEFTVIRSSFFLKKSPYTGQDICHILMDKFAVVCIQDIISAAFLVQSKGKWSVLVFIAKGKFHLVAVPELDWASVDPFPFKISPALCVCLSTLDECIFQKLMDLSVFHLKLILVGHCLVHASAACRKVAAYRLSCLKRGFLQNFQDASLRPAGAFLLDHEPYILTRDSVLDQDFLIIHLDIAFVWKVHFFYNAFVNFTFFHFTYSLSYFYIYSKTAPVICRSCSKSKLLFTVACLLFFVLEIIIKVVVEIFFKILQIIWCEETVNCKCDTCYCCNCTDDCQHPENCVFLFFFFFLVHGRE